MGLRHLLHLAPRRLALPRRRHRPVRPPGGWLGDRRPVASRPGSRRPAHSPCHAPPGSWANPSLRPWQSGRIQVVVATEPLLTDRVSWSNASAGVFQSSVFRGRELRAAATAEISSALCKLRSVPFGKYWRSSPLVFSLVPRCHGL